MKISAARDWAQAERNFYIVVEHQGRELAYLLYPYGVYGFRTPDSLERAANDG